MKNSEISQNNEGESNPLNDPPAPPSSILSRIPSSFKRELAEVTPSESQCYECCMNCLGSCCGCIGAYLCCCECCDCNPYITVPQGKVGIITKFGKAYRIVDPGLYFINRMSEKISFTDIRICISDVPRQVVMTKDNVSVNIDSIVYWHVVDPFVASFQVSNIQLALMQRTMTTLRDIVGSYALQTFIENRGVISASIREIIDEAVRPWGVVVEAILIKDLQFSQDLQETLSSTAKQKRLGESKVISAKAEVQASKLMREAGDSLNSETAMHIRYLDAMNTMAKDGDLKMIFMPLKMNKN